MPMMVSRATRANFFIKLEDVKRPEFIFGRFFDTDWTGEATGDKSRCFLTFVRERTLISKGTP
ncbi:hypothetical protein FB480_101433 [Agrobacterium vitis]|nr:hypothetical protein FB480_101433 [Agrobacterium vitis]